MTISGIGSNNYYMGQMSTMSGRSGSAGISGSRGGHPPDPSEMFSKVDKDGSGGLDQTEFVTLSNKISEMTGKEMDGEEMFAAYDEDGDGVLNEAETQTFMEANRPEGPPPGGPMGGMGGMGGPPPDLSQIFSDEDEDEDGSLDDTEAQSLAELISEATGEETDVEELFAAYDQDGDGRLSEEETVAALEDNRPEGPPPSPGGMTAGIQNSDSTVSSGIESYLKMAALGQGQDQASNSFALFGGNDDSNLAAALHSVNTRV